MKRTLLQEDIGLINKHDGVPAGCNIEYPVQCIIQIRGLSSEVTAAHDVERSADVLAGGLRREGLAYARRAEEVDDKALALALHEVVEAEVGVVCVDEGAEKVFPVCGEHEPVERLVVPFDGTDVLNVELD